MDETGKIERIGKNWYVLVGNYKITVNTTTHKMKHTIALSGNGPFLICQRIMPSRIKSTFVSVICMRKPRKINHLRGFTDSRILLVIISWKTAERGGRPSDRTSFSLSFSDLWSGNRLSSGPDGTRHLPEAEHGRYRV